MCCFGFTMPTQCQFRLNCNFPVGFPLFLAVCVYTQQFAIEHLVRTACYCEFASYNATTNGVLTFLLFLLYNTIVMCRSHLLWVGYGEFRVSNKLFHTWVLFYLFCSCRLTQFMHLCSCLHNFNLQIYIKLYACRYIWTLLVYFFLFSFIFILEM